MLPEAGNDCIVDWFNAYLHFEVLGGSNNTFVAKEADLRRFLHYFAGALHTDALDCWTKSITRGFVAWLQEDANAGKPYAVGTVNRNLATLRHCARWIHRRRPFAGGNPFDGIRDMQVDDPPAVGLSNLEVLRLRSAAEQMLRLATRKDQLPHRNHAILLILLGTGLRVSELLALDLHQYSGKHFLNVRRKGRKVTAKVFLPTDARDALAAYLGREREQAPGPLIQSRNGKRLARQNVHHLLGQIARFANAKLPPDERITLYPHMLRHTLLRRAADKHGVHYAQELSGNVGQQHVWRYVQPTEEHKEEAIEQLFP